MEGEGIVRAADSQPGGIPVWIAAAGAVGSVPLRNDADRVRAGAGFSKQAFARCCRSAMTVEDAGSQVSLRSWDTFTRRTGSPSDPA